MDAIENSRRAFLNNQIEQAVSSLDAILQHEVNYSQDALFDARCIRGSIATLRGPKEDPYLVNLRPKNKGEAHIKSYLEATAMIRAGQPLSAIMKLQAIVREDAHFVAARMGLAAAHMAEKQWNEAFQQYSEVLATTGKNAPAIVRVGLALCAMRRQEFEHAKKCLLRALELEPNDDLACMAMAVVQLQQRDGVGAAETVKRLYGLAPENPIAIQKFADLVFFKGMTNNRLKDVGHAIRDLIATAVKLDEGVNTKEARHRIAYSRFQLGRLEHFDGRFDAAIELYKQSIDVLGTTCKAAVLYLTKAYYQVAKTEEAVECLQRLDNERKADKDVYTMLISHHIMVNNHVRAMFYAQKLADEFGVGDPKTYWLRAFASRHNPQNALRSLAIAKAIPNQPVSEKVAYTEEFLRAQQPETAGAGLGEMLSTLQKIQGEKDEQKMLAPAAVTAALSKTPELLPHYYNIACAMTSSSAINDSSSSAASSSDADANRGRRLQAAIKVLVAIIKAFPTFADPYYRLAEVYIAHKQFGSAIKWLSLLLHVRPNDGHALTMIAKLYFDNRNSRVAVETLRRGIVSSTGGENAEKDEKASLVASMALGSLLLWSAQQPSEKAPRHLLGAKECFSKPLRSDPRNALAAHGLACAVGFGGNAVSKGARSELTENTLATVLSVSVNDASLKAHAKENMVNCMARSQSYKRVIDELQSRAATLNAAQTGTLGYSLAADGQLAEASAVIQKGLERFPAHLGLRYNRILVLYALISKEIGTGAQINDGKGREIRSLIVLASDLSHEFVSLKHSGTDMNVTAFNDAQQNVKAMAKQLVRLEECLQYAVRKSAIEAKISDAKVDEWRQQATEVAAAEAQRKLEEEAAAEELERQKAEKSRRRYNAMLELQTRGMGGGEEGDAHLTMVTGAGGYAGEVLGDEQPELTGDALAEAIDGEALLAV